MNLLFVCSRNRRRSLTAETIFGDEPGLQALSAGTAPDAETAVSIDLLQWADVIFAMEAIHKRRLIQRFPREMKDKRIVVLGIADHYEYMDRELVVRMRSEVVNRLGSPEL